MTYLPLHILHTLILPETNKYEMDADHHNLNPCKTVLIVDKMVDIVTCMELVGLC